MTPMAAAKRKTAAASQKTTKNPKSFGLRSRRSEPCIVSNRPVRTARRATKRSAEAATTHSVRPATPISASLFHPVGRAVADVKRDAHVAAGNRRAFGVGHRKSEVHHRAAVL